MYHPKLIFFSPRCTNLQGEGNLGPTERGRTLRTLHASRVAALRHSPIKRPFGRLPYRGHADRAVTAPEASDQRCLTNGRGEGAVV